MVYETYLCRHQKNKRILGEKSMKLKALILDDETANLEHLSYWLEKYCSDQIEVVATSTTVQKAASAINELAPEVLFLDVELANGINSFELLREIPDWEGKIVFITAHKDYAIDAIKAKAYDYLLKPISIEELTECVNKLYDSFEGYSQSEPKHEMARKPLTNDFITIYHLSEIQLIRLDEIMYLASSGNYTEFFLKDGSSTVSSKIIKIYEGMLQGRGFIRIHNSYVVNLHYLLKIEKENGWICVMKDGKNLPISRRKKDSLLDLLNPQ